jgi:hypothetical protein
MMFSLLETLIALALTVVLMAAAVPLVAANSGVLAVAPEMLDEQQRARLGMEELSRDLGMAGAGSSVGPIAGPLVSSFAPIIPRRMGLTGADAYNVARTDAITIIYASASPAQSVLMLPMNSPYDSLQLDPSGGCPLGTQVCGLQKGSTALLFDQNGQFDLVGILGLTGSAATIEIRQSGSPAFSYQSGSPVAEAESHTYYFDAANLQLRHADGAHSDVPVVDNVVALSFEYFGDPNPPLLPKPQVGTANCLYDAAGVLLGGMSILPAAGGTLAILPPAAFTDGPWCGSGSNRYDADLLRVRMIRVTLRVQAASDTMRGRSADFLIPGLNRGASTVPDYTMRFDVTPANMGSRR